MEHDARQTFVVRGGQQYIAVDTLSVRGLCWAETWQAAMGFLKDPNVPNDSFSATDLQSLIVAAQTRRDQICPPDSNTGDQP